MAEIIDLDDALPPNKKVRIRGAVYDLPGDIPTPLFLGIQRALGNLGDDDGIEGLYNSIIELFKACNPKVDNVPLGIAEMTNLFASVYGVKEQEERPPQQTRGTGTSSRSPRNKSRS